jgi:hypothetical protein
MASSEDGRQGFHMTFKQQWLIADSVVALILALSIGLVLLMLSSTRLP